MRNGIVGLESLKPQIVCFGDSLTVGYQSPTPDNPEYRETPYGAFLGSLLKERFDIVVTGICGELTGEMLKRFPRDVLKRDPKYVVILGGTNDLGWNVAPSDVMRNLAMMFEQATGKGIRPVAVTVPSFRPPGIGHSSGKDPFESVDRGARRLVGSHIDLRLKLNKMLLNWCTENEMTCVDLFSHTAEEGTRFLAARYSNDGLHLSTEGYQLLANLLWQNVFRADQETPYMP